MGGLRVFISLPVLNYHTFMVLSLEPVTRYLSALSMPILLIGAVCIHVSILSIGSFDGSAEKAVP